MENKDIIKGNKLIVSFMGGNINNTDYYGDFSGCEYNYSWNELMPVIGKISNQCEEPEELDDLKYALLTDNIEEAYIFVTSYIESYNSLDINKVLKDGKD